MAEMVRNYLVIGAHPDDPDLLFGGCAVKLLKAGHRVKFVSVSSGDCGHYAMEPAALALRRHREAQESAKVAGLTGYEILDVPDCHVVCTLELREKLIRVIRDFGPDVVISHRLCDYHADHRATAQCVMDCAYLVRVPMYCADTPILRKDPVFAYGYDAFTDPRPIRADAVTEIDSVAETKLRMLDCHRSQFYEWLPWNMGLEAPDPDRMSRQERQEYLDRHWGGRDRQAAEFAREALRERYGARGDEIRRAELFELSPYGAQPAPAEFRALFPD